MTAQELVLPAVTTESALVGLAVLVGGVVLALLVRVAAKALLRWRGRGVSAVRVFSGLIAWLIVLLAVGAALTVVFPSVKPVNILGGVGVISIAAGIAFQTVLGNMFAGIVILARDHFNVGDQISVRDVRGTVRAISLTSTTVRTFDGRLVLIPNAVVHSEIVTVQTGFEAVRSSVMIELDQATDLALAHRVVESAMLQPAETLDEPVPHALFTEVGTGTVTLELRFWSGALQLETREAQHAVIRDVLSALAEHDIATGSEAFVVEAGEQLGERLDALAAATNRRSGSSG